MCPQDSRMMAAPMMPHPHPSPSRFLACSELSSDQGCRWDLELCQGPERQSWCRYVPFGPAENWEWGADPKECCGFGVAERLTCPSHGHIASWQQLLVFLALLELGEPKPMDFLHSVTLSASKKTKEWKARASRSLSKRTYWAPWAPQESNSTQDLTAVGCGSKENRCGGS